MILTPPTQTCLELGLSFVASFLIALLRVKTVNLSELATAFSGKAQPDSHYKRLQRSFREFEVDDAGIAQTIVTLLAIPEPWVLSLDRTNWQLGESTFNILMLGVVHQGVAFPLVWCCLDKRGNSNSTERMSLFNQFIEQFGELLVCPQTESLSVKIGSNICCLSL
jgi:hypothetical protein